MKSIYAGAVVCVSVAVACALGAHAEERTVSTAAGLVEALEALNAKSAPATPNIIYLERGNYDVSSYAMKHWSSSGKASTSAKHIALAHVTVSGKSDNPRDTVIYGNGTDGIVHCYVGSLRHLTISNGCETGTETLNRAGGVYNTGADSIHSNVIVTCCSSATIGGGASSGTWYDSTIISNRSSSNGGGVIFGTWYNCNIVSNSASTSKTGGGCYYETVLHDCRVIGNRAKYGGGLGGGDGKTHYCRVYGGVIADNYAGTYGGGGYRTEFLGGTVVSNNTSASSGGGVYMEATIVVTNTVICCNTAKYGGGVSGKGIFSDCEIYGNTATATGGGINNGFATNCVIYANSAKDGGGCGTGAYVDCVISNNTASGAGGGAYSGSSTNCAIYANSAKDGGGACSNECVSCELVGNRATYGGGCHYGTTTNCTIASNISTAYGGGAYVGTHTDDVLTNNLAKSQGGGGYSGIYRDCLIACNMVTSSVDKVYGGGLRSGVAYRCVISNNVVESIDASSGGAYGAGAYASQIFDSTVTFNMNYGGFKDAYGGGMNGGCASNSLFTGNACYAPVASGKNIQGGGGYATYFTNCVIRNNYTRSNSGCGVNGGGANGCLISNNVGTSSAGYTVRQVSELKNCEVVGVANVRNCSAVNCRFVNFTNGYYLAKNENVVMDPKMRYHISGPINYTGTTATDQELIYSGFVATNCLIANNRTSGGLIQATASLKVILHNCTVANNVCNYTFLGATNGTHACAINTIFVGNKTSKGEACDMNFPSVAKSYVALTNCLIGSGRQAVAVPEWEVNTVTSDVPCFVKGEGRDYYALKYFSPARGKGLVMDWMTDATDIRQDPACPRLRDGKVDIGCYQCWLDPVGLWFSIR